MENTANFIDRGEHVVEPSAHARSKQFQLNFQGNAKEYFSIWIVNTALTILTLGVFSAWAKVRKKRYFCGNTFLDGNSFEYLASPITILKGRVIAVVLFIIYWVLTNFFPVLILPIIIIAALLLPWIIIALFVF